MKPRITRFPPSARFDAKHRQAPQTSRLLRLAYSVLGILAILLAWTAVVTFFALLATRSYR
jgi:hypothetical protein